MGASLGPSAELVVGVRKVRLGIRDVELPVENISVPEPIVQASRLRRLRRRGFVGVPEAQLPLLVGGEEGDAVVHESRGAVDSGAFVINELREPRDESIERIRCLVPTLPSEDVDLKRRPWTDVLQGHVDKSAIGVCTRELDDRTEGVLSSLARLVNLPEHHDGSAHCTGKEQKGREGCDESAPGGQCFDSACACPNEDGNAYRDDRAGQQGDNGKHHQASFGHQGASLLSNDQTFSPEALPERWGGGPEGPSGLASDTADVGGLPAVRVSGSSQARFGLDDFDGASPRVVRRRNYRIEPISPPRTDELEALYEQRAAARLTPRSVTTYRWLRKDMLAVASSEAGRPIDLQGLFTDRALLGRVLVSDRLADGQPCSKSTLAHRRTAIRSVAVLLRPELQDILACDPEGVIRAALRGAAERRGGGFRINAGTPRMRGGPTPDADELNAIIAAMGQSEGWVGLRDRAFAILLATTASRVTALRTLDGADCHVLSGDRVRVLLHQKNGRERHEVELTREGREALRLYMFAFNEAMRAAGRSDRISLGEPGPIWRTERGGQLPDKALRTALRTACRVAGTQDYTPHAFRRAWATTAAEVLPRWEGALGGGWRGTERFDASYVTPSRTAVWRKLAGVGVEDRSPPEPQQVPHEPAPAL